jgi:hypothetical protein
MLQIAEILRQILVPFLFIGGSLLGVLLGYLVLQRVIRDLAAGRRLTLVTRYRSAIDAITQGGPAPQALDRLRRAPASHRPIVAGLLLAPLRSARGDLVLHVREAAMAIGLVEQWLADLENRRWWVRAEGVRALAFVQEPSALPAILHALDDEHEEVRAAAVEAAGRLGDPRAIPALLEHLADGPGYQRARVVEALRILGPPVTPALVELARARPDQTRLVADVLALIGTAAAIDPLLTWCGDSRTDVRAAALAALGSIGLDDRSYYYALRALGDPDPHVRAMGARALGRSSRQEAASYLAERLDDEWLAAAHAAAALRRLGATGRVALEARAHDQGQAGDLARQMLWERQPIAAEA